MSELGDFWLVQHSDVRVAWLAGIYEGEGCLTRSIYGQWSIKISMTDEDVVRRCQEITGLGSVKPLAAARPEWSPQTAWRVTSHAQVEYVLELILPFLGERRRAKADEFLRWYRSGAERQVNPEDQARHAARTRLRRARRRAMVS